MARQTSGASGRREALESLPTLVMWRDFLELSFRLPRHEGRSRWAFRFAFGLTDAPFSEEM